MTARRQRYTPENFLPDPLAEAALQDQAGVAEKLATILEGLREFDQNSVMGYLYRKPATGMGKFEFAERMTPPNDAGDLMEVVKEKYGGGDYRLQVFAGGKTRGNCEFSVMGPPKPIAGATPAAADPMGGTGMFATFMAMQAESRREMAQMQEAARREAAEARREQAERDARRDESMWKAAALILPAALPLMLGGREKLGDLLAIVNASKPEPSNLKDTLETVALVKKLFSDDDKPAGFDPENIAGSLMRLAGPVAAAAGRAFNGGRQGPPPAEEGEGDPPPYGDGRLHLPPPPPAPEVAPAPAAPTVQVPPVLALIRPHVLYFFSAAHDPGLAAEAIVDVMVRAGVTDEDVNGVVAAFTLSADWQAELAAAGIDLRGNPDWADAFLDELVAAWPERHRDGDRGAGGAGRVADPGNDADARPQGLAVDDDTRPGA